MEWYEIEKLIYIIYRKRVSVYYRVSSKSKPGGELIFYL